MTTVSILGSTGVIGRLTLEVLQQFPEDFQVIGLAAGENTDLLVEQIRMFHPRCVSVATELASQNLRDHLHHVKYDSPIEIGVGDAGNCAVADCGSDTVVSAIVGTRGLLPTWRAVERGATVALANKETLVAAGDLVMNYAVSRQSTILPVDSEHSALFQCLQAGTLDELGRYWITASGGPFRTWSQDDMRTATITDALKHPTWSMGRKITIDSATLMNKGLEVIEAHHLFRASYDKINVVVHPQSIVHSMVEYRDGSVIAQLGTHDMRLPIQYALTYPHRMEASWPRLSLTEVGQLTFEEPDYGKFPCLRLAFEAGRAGGSMPCVLNAANEAAVAAALAGDLPFARIASVVEEVLLQHQRIDPKSVDEVIAIDTWAKQAAMSVIQKGG